MSVTINPWRWRELVSRMIVFGVLGLITSGCPMMMSMMDGMSSNQHKEQKKESPANTADGAIAPKSHNTDAGH